TRDRELQPVMDSAGRIAGFFTWDRSRPMAQVVGWFASFFAAIAVVLFGIAALSLWQLKRSRRGKRKPPVRPMRTSLQGCLTTPRHWNYWTSLLPSAPTVIARSSR
ncbi:MAG TPA: hypothetical protein VKP52_09615, partial [Pseudolabrys sp.]|nr:hypothetical protein [Pseudolabrys sp.]